MFLEHEVVPLHSAAAATAAAAYFLFSGCPSLGLELGGGTVFSVPQCSSTLLSAGNLNCFVLGAHSAGCLACSSVLLFPLQCLEPCLLLTGCPHRWYLGCSLVTSSSYTSTRVSRPVLLSTHTGYPSTHAVFSRFTFRLCLFTVFSTYASHPVLCVSLTLFSSPLILSFLYFFSPIAPLTSVA
eukprot:1159684-Pelagomonas_calceolata.AAC.8